jgi:hypothetical protein
MLNTITIGTAKAEYFQFAVFVLPTGNGGYFSCSDVQTNNDW